MPSGVLPAGRWRVPVRDFLDSLKDIKQQAAIAADLSLLEEEGPVLPFLHAFRKTASSQSKREYNLAADRARRVR